MLCRYFCQVGLAAAGARIALYFIVLHYTVAFALFSAVHLIQHPARLTPHSPPHLSFFHVALRPRKPYGLLGTGKGGDQVIPVLQPVKTEETVSHLQNNKVKEVGTPPVPSNLSTSRIAASTAVRSEVTKTVSDEQLLRGKNKLQQGSPSCYESPAPPPCS